MFNSNVLTDYPQALKKNIPFTLIILRLVLGLLLLLFYWLKVDHFKWYAISFLIIGLLSDIFDGIIARKLAVSTTLLRRWDSSVDLLFFACVSLVSYLSCPQFFKDNATLILILVGSEILTYIISFAKFKKEIATHSIGAKIWTLFLFALLVELLLHCQSTILFQLTVWLGLLTRLEIIAIILTLKNWSNDIPSIYHAIQLRKGKAILKNKLFNS
ncbi:CDP-alcohol phosphatidyltransferase family protein [Sphingobacterium paramultivorum]|uniref:CDP-alcohol phosphatidyltransferase family protein n=1 Tax=Sphingobacterium paramultivorum TaxID=2886510 RepID=A0A7G5EBE8_9SPHI|nr:CDP-alcohol phosphatidyltransferase [Sphingobacterium sp. UME9]QMV71323.1 CDP-alcohol phosphatidyltransferase family protein [Sphingobacterium paramultivorum]